MISRKNGFSLVELSIVLVILGLLVGGVMSGQSLIHAAQLRTITTDAETYRVAVNLFKEKYMAMPGDMTNATQFWGAMGTCPPASSYSPYPAPGEPTCDGNGDGRVLGTSYAEALFAWQHLGNAGLIKGRYNGISAGGGGSQGRHAMDANCPSLRYDSRSCWGISYIPASGTPTGTTGLQLRGEFFQGREGNMLLAGRPWTSSFSGYSPVGPFLMPEDMWNIDTKFDDGLPDTGAVQAGDANLQANCTVVNGGRYEYNLTDTTDSCGLMFRSPL